MPETVAEREKRYLVLYALARVKSEEQLVRAESTFYREVAPDVAVYQERNKRAVDQLSSDEESATCEEQRVLALATFHRVQDAAWNQFMRSTDSSRRKYDTAIQQCAIELAEVQRVIDENFV